MDTVHAESMHYSFSPLFCSSPHVSLSRRFFFLYLGYASSTNVKNISFLIYIPYLFKKSLGFRVWGLGFGVWSLGFGFQGLGLGFGVWGLGFRVSGLGFRVWGFGSGV